MLDCPKTDNETGSVHMSKLTMSAAARIVGISRQKLYNDIKSKSISVDRSDPKKPTIDTSELLRVYGELQGADSTQDVKPRQKFTPGNDNGLDRLQAEVEALRREKIASLEARIEAAEKERDEWRDQARSWQEQAETASRLLVDLRQEADPPPPSIAPETPSAAAPEPRTGGFWSLLLGK